MPTGTYLEGSPNALTSCRLSTVPAAESSVAKATSAHHVDSIHSIPVQGLIDRNETFKAMFEDNFSCLEWLRLRRTDRIEAKILTRNVTHRI
jgi:hypothetical protein